MEVQKKGNMIKKWMSKQNKKQAKRKIRMEIRNKWRRRRTTASIKI